ncbi:hypothetical protein ACQP3C_29845, partial [Escherichia coli]
SKFGSACQSMFGKQTLGYVIQLVLKLAFLCCKSKAGDELIPTLLFNGQCIIFQKGPKNFDDQLV